MNRKVSIGEIQVNEGERKFRIEVWNKHETK